MIIIADYSVKIRYRIKEHTKDNGCERVPGSISNRHDACPLIGETLIISCSSDTTYDIAFNDEVLATNEDLVVHPFTLANRGEYECQNHPNGCTKAKSGLEIYTAGKYI